MDTILKWGNPLHKSCPLFLLGFGVITIYVPGVFGAAITTGWLYLFIVIPILFLYCDIKLGFGFLFICYAILSLLWTETFNIGLYHLSQVLLLGCIFCVGQNIKDLKPVFKGLALGLGVSAIIGVCQKFGYKYIYTLNEGIAGLFINPNIFSEISVILLISLLILKLWWWIPVTLPGLILTQSRAAFIALIVGLIIWAWKLNKYLAIILFLSLSIIGIAFYWTRFDISSINERLSLWSDTIKGFNLFGNGVGSFEIVYPLYATNINTEVARPQYAHNDILNLVFEFGIGSILLLMVIFNVFKNKSSELIILYSIFTISLFTYPLHVPTTAFITFLVAGYITSNFNTDGSIWDNRGSILPSRIKRKRLSKVRSS